MNQKLKIELSYDEANEILNSAKSFGDNFTRQIMYKKMIEALTEMIEAKTPDN